jgi:hypothetical protein
VYLRTNLLPSSEACVSSKREEDMSGGGGRSSIELDSHPTVVRSHPELPYLFVGEIDDSISVIAPESWS